MSNSNHTLYYQIRQKILSWYRKEKRNLPWRVTPHPYNILLSEFILQQTRIEQGVGYYYRILDRYPSIHHLAHATENDLLKLWEGLGYYRRALHLLKTAQIIVTQFHGEIPQQYDKLTRLPGIGDYTASMILSICYHKPYPAIDGNVKRIIARLFKIKFEKETQRFNKEIRAITERLISKKFPGDFNQALMDLGAMICLPKNPKCAVCPLSSHCQAYKENSTHLYPVNKKKKDLPVFHWIVLYIKHNDQIVLKKEQNQKFLNGLYSLPWMEVHNLQTLRRPKYIIKQLLASLNIYLNVEWKEVFTHYRQYSSKNIHFHVFSPTTKIQTHPTTLQTPYEWIPITQIHFLPFSKAFTEILDKLLNEVSQ